MTPTKLINYNGGVARFRIPAFWLEEHNPSGEAVFYEDRPDSGTLRVNVLDVRKTLESVNSAKTVNDFLIEVSGPSEVKQLHGDAAMTHAIKEAVENGKTLLLHIWQVGVRVTPTHFRLIIFTFTFLEKNKSDSEMKQEIASLDRFISEGEYPACSCPGQPSA